MVDEQKAKSLAQTLHETISDSTDGDSHASDMSETIDDGNTDNAPQITGDHILHQFNISSDIQKRFSIGSTLGTGSGGAVFDLVDNNLDRTVAAKFLSKEFAQSKIKIQKFMREALITSRLDHPNILPVYDLASSSDDQIYYTMKKVDGIPLTELTHLDHSDANEKELSLIQSSNTIGEIVNIFIKICETIAYAHSHGIIHRDIKPDNVMLGKYGEVRVVDWGIAFDNNTSKKHNGKMSGTPHYMSPEQANCQKADERSDIYSIGASLFHVLFKRTPILAKTHELFWQQKKNGLYQTPNQVEQEHLPKTLVAICLKCLEKDPENRYQKASDLISDLKNFQIGGSIGAYHYNFWELLKQWGKHNKSNLKWAALVAVVIGIAWTFIYQQSQREYAGWGKPIYSENFDNSSSWQQDWVTYEGTAEIENNSLVSKTGSSFTAFYKHLIQGGARFEFDGCMLADASPGDLTVVYSPDIHDTDSNGRINKIYYLQTAGQGNASASIRGPSGSLDYVINSLTPGEVYRIRGDIDGKKLRLYINNSLVCAYDLLLPLNAGYVGIYGFYSGKQFDNFKIYNKELPEVANIIQTGDLLFDNGLYDRAAKRYLKISRVHKGSNLADEALYKYGLSLYRQDKVTDAFAVWSKMEESEFNNEINFHRWSELYKDKKIDLLLKEMGTLYEKSKQNDQKNIRIKWSKLLSQTRKDQNIPLTKKLLNFRKQHFPNDQMFSFEVYLGLRLLEDFPTALKSFPEQEIIKCRALLHMGRFEEIIRDYSEHRVISSEALLHSGQYNTVIAEHSDMGNLYLDALLAAGYIEKAKMEFADNDKKMERILMANAEYDEVIKRYPDRASQAYLHKGDLSSYRKLMKKRALEASLNQRNDINAQSHSNIILAMKAYAEGDKKEALKTIDKHMNARLPLTRSDVNAMFRHYFIDIVLSALEGNDKALLERLNAIYDEKQPKLYMRLWYCTALILGKIEDDAFFEQPYQRALKDDFFLYKGIHFEINNDKASALECYLKLKKLKPYQSKQSVLERYFVDYRIKELQ